MTNKKAKQKISIWQHIKRYIKSPDFVVLLILLAASVLALLPLLSLHAYMFGHDSDFHVGSVIGLEQGNLLDIFNQKIIPSFADNLGYGTGIFYPQLPHYLAAVVYHFIKIFGLGPIAAMKIVYFLVVFFSGYFMYRFLRHNFKRRTPALLSAILYMTAPYFVSDILVRDAMNETFLFLFIPLALFGFQYLLEKNYRRFLILFIIGYIGLIHVHLVMTMFFTGIFAIVALLYIKEWLNIRSIKYIIISIVVVILSSLSFLVPILQHKNVTSYEVFSGGMYTREEVASRTMSPADYLGGQYVGVEGTPNVAMYSNVLTIALAIFAVYVYRQANLRENKGIKFLFITGLIFCIVSIFISGELMPWLKLPKFLSAIQFPWRMVTFLTVGLTLLSSITLYALKVKAASIISIACIAACIFYASNVYSTAAVYDDFDTATMSSKTRRYLDYYPTVLWQNLEEIEAGRDQKALVTNGKATISEFSNTPTLLSFRASDISEPTTIEIPKIYYLGYEITTDSGGRLPYTESANGLIEFTLDHNTTISVKYVNTRAGQIASVVSGLTLIGFGIYALTPREIWYNKLNAKTKV